jgi:hypothetical protein
MGIKEVCIWTVTLQIKRAKLQTRAMMRVGDGGRWDISGG